MNSETALDLKNSLINIAAVLRNRVFSAEQHISKKCVCSESAQDSSAKYYFLHKPSGEPAPTIRLICCVNHSFQIALMNIMRMSPPLPFLPTDFVVI